MSGLLDRISAAGSEERRLEVPEWGEDGKPLVIRYRPPSLDNVAEAVAACPDSPIHQNIDVFLQIAKGEDGKPLFQDPANPSAPWRLNARLALASAPGAAPVLTRVMREMGIIGETAEQHEKN